MVSLVFCPQHSLQYYFTPHTTRTCQTPQSNYKAQVLAAHGLVDDKAASRNGQSGNAAATAAGEETKEDAENRRNFGFWWTYVAGLFAGLCQTAVVVPTDSIKVKLQVGTAVLYEYRRAEGGEEVSTLSVPLVVVVMMVVDCPFFLHSLIEVKNEALF